MNDGCKNKIQNVLSCIIIVRMRRKNKLCFLKFKTFEKERQNGRRKD